jgi:fatty-acid desaturase
MWYDGLLQFTLWQKVVTLLILTHVSIVGVTVYLHRYSSHRALELHPVAQHFFRFWLWLATSINTREFTAIHRKHHAVTETEEDPHSPKFYGLKELLWNGIYHYTVQAAIPETLEKYGRGCPDDWIERNLYGRYAIGGVAALLLIYLALFGVLGLTMWAIQMMWIPFLALGVVNGVGHVWGYRNFECADAATNVSPLGIIIGGEELHNNHHAYPNSAKLSQRWFEFDIGWMWIKVLS